MNAKSLIAAVMFVSTGAAFAADAPEASAAASATASTSKLNLPALGAPSHASRDEVKAEATDAVKNYKTPLALQLDQYKN